MLHVYTLTQLYSIIHLATHNDTQAWQKGTMIGPAIMRKDDCHIKCVGKICLD